MIPILQVRQIADIMMDETRSRVAGKGVELVVGRRLMERIIRDGYSLEYGVRPLRQVRAWANLYALSCLCYL